MRHIHFDLSHLLQISILYTSMCKSDGNLCPLWSDTFSFPYWHISACSRCNLYVLLNLTLAFKRTSLGSHGCSSNVCRIIWWNHILFPIKVRNKALASKAAANRMSNPPPNPSWTLLFKNWCVFFPIPSTRPGKGKRAQSLFSGSFLFPIPL